MSPQQLKPEEAIALSYYLERDPNLPASLVPLLRRLKSSQTSSANAFNTVCYPKSFNRPYISQSASQVDTRFHGIPDGSFTGLPTPSSLIAQGSPDKQSMHTSQDHTPCATAFNTIGDFLSDDYANSADQIWTPLSSPTTLFQGRTRQPLTNRFPPENSVCFIMILELLLLIFYLCKASLSQKYPTCVSQLESMDADIWKAPLFPAHE